MIVLDESVDSWRRNSYWRTIALIWLANTDGCQENLAPRPREAPMMAQVDILELLNLDLIYEDGTRLLYVGRSVCWKGFSDVNGQLGVGVI
jgi:hypothetical protein